MNAINWFYSGKTISRANIAIFVTAIIISQFVCSYDCDFFIKALTYYFTTLLALNTILWRPGGTSVNSNGQACFVIGTKTSITYYQITACLFAYVYYKVEKDKKKGGIVFGILLLSLLVYNILQPISTSIVCLAIFVLMIVLDTLMPKLSKIILRLSFWVLTIINILLVVFRIQDLFKYLIVDVLGEDLTLDGRTYIWDEALFYISKNPLWGYGQNSGITLLTDYNMSTHNQLLGWAFRYGIVGLVVMLALCIWLIYRFSVDDIRGRIVRLIFTLLSLMWITEHMLSDIMFVLITIVLFNLDKFDISDNKNMLAQYFYFEGKNGN